MASCAIIVFMLALFMVAKGQSGTQEQKLSCIRQKLSADLSTYSDKYNRLQSTAIVRVKQALQEVLKDENVVKTASNGQMTIDANAFSNMAQRLQNKNVGTAMTTCKNRPNADHLYAEAARAVQCVFEELKKTC